MRACEFKCYQSGAVLLCSAPHSLCFFEVSSTFQPKKQQLSKVHKETRNYFNITSIRSNQPNRRGSASADHESPIGRI